MDNLAANVMLEKSWVHNFIKSKHLVKLFSEYVKDYMWTNKSEYVKD